MSKVLLRFSDLPESLALKFPWLGEEPAFGLEEILQAQADKAIKDTLWAVREELLPFIAAEEPLSIPLLDEDVIDALLERTKARLE